MEISGATAVLSGANRGIGAATVNALFGRRSSPRVRGDAITATCSCTGAECRPNSSGRNRPYAGGGGRSCVWRRSDTRQ
jgi:NAD(P)-dependent dehydrogenase (short-subunit alcohol dehydrogenase family)